MSKDLISCPWNKQECQAFTDGRCIALKDADFGGRPCPFYKSYDQADKAWLDAIAAWLVRASTMKRTAVPREDG